MKNSKWIVIIALMILVVGSGTFYFLDTGLLKGSADRDGKGKRSVPPVPAENEEVEELDENVPWWCKKIEQNNWSDENKGVDGEPTGGSERIVDVKSPKGGSGEGNRGSDSSKKPGNRGGFARFNPASSKIEIDNPYIDQDIISQIDVPANIWMKYKRIPTIAGGAGSGGSKRGGKTPKVPPVDPKKPTVEIYHECSCDADYFNVKELPDSTFWCPQPGEKVEFVEVESKGVKYKVVAYTPSDEFCQKDKKDNETVDEWYHCECDQKSFYNEKLDEAFDCPENGGYIEYEPQKNYFLALTKDVKLSCDPKWDCPNGYDWDNDKLYKNCKKVKQAECGATDTVGDLVPGDAELCDAWGKSYWNKFECASFEDCQKSIEIMKSLGDYELVKAKIDALGLPDLDTCESLFGDGSSGWQ